MKKTIFSETPSNDMPDMIVGHRVQNVIHRNKSEKLLQYFNMSFQRTYDHFSEISPGKKLTLDSAGSTPDCTFERELCSRFTCGTKTENFSHYHL